MRTVLCCVAVLSLFITPEPAAAGRKKKKSRGPVVELATTMGKIQIKLNAKKAPVTVRNFLGYVKSGFYKGTIFHRVIKNFMIQGGGFKLGMKKKPTKLPIQNEASNGLSNKRGTIAMARTSDPHSASAQFFINVKNNAALNFKSKTRSGWGYCVFGKVIKGMGVVDKIRAVPTGRLGPYGDVPLKPVVIKNAKILR